MPDVEARSLRTARRDINPISGEWEELVGGEGRWMLALRHSTGRLRPMSYYGNEFKVRQVNLFMRAEGHRTVVIDRARAVLSARPTEETAG